MCSKTWVDFTSFLFASRINTEITRINVSLYSSKHLQLLLTLGQLWKIERVLLGPW